GGAAPFRKTSETSRPAATRPPALRLLGRRASGRRGNRGPPFSESTPRPDETSSSLPRRGRADARRARRVRRSRDRLASETTILRLLDRVEEGVPGDVHARPERRKSSFSLKTASTTSSSILTLAIALLRSSRHRNVIRLPGNGYAD